MPITRKTIGTGMTQRVVTYLEDPVSKEDIAEAKRIVEEDGHHSDFESRVKRTEVFCQRLLAKAKLPLSNTAVRMDSDGNWTDDLPRAENWPEDAREILRPGESVSHALDVAKHRYGTDSPEWFAAGILQGIDHVRTEMASCDMAKAVYRAWDLGLLIKTFEVKFTWEREALAGKAMREARTRGTENSAPYRAKKAQEAEQAYAKWQNYANDRWHENESLSTVRMAHFVGEAYGVSPHTVRKHLRKPERLSPS